MDKVKIKKIILILCVVLSIVIISLIILLFNNLNKEEEFNESKETTDALSKNGEETPSEEDIEIAENTITRNDLFIIKSVVQNYLQAININNSSYFTYQDGEEVRLYTETEISEQVYSLLSSTYINKNNIKSSDVFNYIEKVSEDVIFIPIELKEVENSNLKTYIVYGVTQTYEYKIVEEVYFVVNIDKDNNTYSIEPLSGQYKSIDDIVVEDVETSIENQELNVYYNISSSTEDTIKLYFDIYKRLALSIPEYSYNYLNTEYKEKRFETLEKYEEYILNNESYIKQLKLSEYKSTTDGSTIVYTIKDNTGNYIIIKEDEPLNFNIMLDAYTIDINEVAEKYESSSDEEKVGMNIQAFIQMINRNDYESAYSVLADSFKNNKFKSLDEFEKYVKNNFYDINEITISNVEDAGTYFTGKATISDSEGNSKTISVVMQLKETGFVMSFSLE